MLSGCFRTLFSDATFKTLYDFMAEKYEQSQTSVSVKKVNTMSYTMRAHTQMCCFAVIEPRTL